MQHNYTFVHSSFANAFHSCLSLLSVILHHGSQAAVYPHADLLNLPLKQELPFILNSAQQRTVVGKVAKLIFFNDLSMYPNMKDYCILFAPQVFLVAFFFHQKG